MRLAALAAVAVLGLAATPGMAAPGASPVLTVTATPQWTETYPWTIDKSVAPGTWDLFAGDTGTSRYTISLTKGTKVTTGQYDVAVSLTVHNAGDDSTADLLVTMQMQRKSGGSTWTNCSALLDVTSQNNPIGPRATVTYTGTLTLNAADQPWFSNATTYSVLCSVYVSNHPGPKNTVGPKTTTQIAGFTPAATVVNNTINVDDTNGGSWAFSASGSVSYDTTFSCEDEGTHENTATIRQTGQSDSATVTVNCYELVVTKTANTSLTRTYVWTVEKNAECDSTGPGATSTATVTYIIEASATAVDSDWAVGGVITIANPNPTQDAVINTVTDLLDLGTDVPGTVSGEFPLTIPAGGSVSLTYSAALAGEEDGTNTATATLQNHAFAPDGVATDTGTTDFSTEPVGFWFSAADITEVDKTVGVYDSMKGYLGDATAPDGASFSYQVVNTASIGKAGG